MKRGGVGGVWRPAPLASRHRHHRHHPHTGTWTHTDDDTTLIVCDLHLAGIGWNTTADAQLAVQAAAQARDYVRELMDVEGQMAELEREREQLKAALDAEQNGDGPKEPGEAGEADDGGTGTASGAQKERTADLGPPPVDPEAT